LERVLLAPRSHGRKRSCRRAERRISSSRPLVPVTERPGNLIYHYDGFTGNFGGLWNRVGFYEGSELLVFRHLVRDRVVFSAFVVPDNIA